jgi:hypothetical protein
MQEVQDETREDADVIEETDEQAESGVASRLGSLKLPALCGGGVAGATGIVSAISHFGLVGGLTITAVAAIVAWRHGPDLIEEYWHPTVVEADPVTHPEPETEMLPATGQKVQRTLKQRLMGQFPDAPEVKASATHPEPETRYCQLNETPKADR